MIITQNSKEILLDNISKKVTIVVGDLDTASVYIAKLCKAHTRHSDNEVFVAISSDKIYMHPKVIWVDNYKEDMGVYIEHRFDLNKDDIFPEDADVFVFDEEIPEWLLETGLVITQLRAKDVHRLTLSQMQLQSTDWEIIRELERMFLSDHPLHLKREVLRARVDEELNHG
ncbi:hypothetical protein [Vibrio sp. ER1A]|uniref:hypothetical protein n=1 Tax=Vibrio sp. ER1A TaxID=1517681 RepID=UPI0004DCF40E|nr:hypothetical protein [Vibrio sp. ER1A]KFA97560.1 hypothetical protein HW45_09130 [Vibrio sp. ER1A]